MDNSLHYWADLYRSMKDKAVCIDIERSSFNGPISLIGWYEPKDGVADCNFLLRGQNLSPQAVRAIFRHYKMLITYNGISYDVPAIRGEFPSALPEDIKVLDLYLLAKKLNLNAGLKVLETTLNVERSHTGTLKRGWPTRLWQRYEQHGDSSALMKLLEYNRQDVVNLYPLAEQLTSMIPDVHDQL
jgi:uncharacterized protein YprB with RNaseH-like and TPR domain